MYGMSSMAKQPLVSVIVPTHNRPVFLRKTLESILKQTYKNLEVIVVSNGVNDANRNVIKALKDPRLIYLDQENTGGPSSPRNHGIREAKGEYVAFCDDDDLWMPEKIEKQLQSLEAHPDYGVCFCKMLRFDEEKEWPVVHEEGPATFDTLLYVNTVPISSVFIRKRLLDQNGSFSESKAVGTSEDYEFLLRQALRTKFYYLDEYLIRYWSGANRTTQNDMKRSFLDILRYFQGIRGCFFELYKTGCVSGIVFVRPVLFHVWQCLKMFGYQALH